MKMPCSTDNRVIHPRGNIRVDIDIDIAITVDSRGSVELTSI